LEAHPTEIDFELYTASPALEAFNYREEFDFNFDPSHLLRQGVNPVELIRQFGDRIYHVSRTGAIATWEGRSGILSSHLNSATRPMFEQRASLGANVAVSQNPQIPLKSRK
jgi:hypothetical protein